MPRHDIFSENLVPKVERILLNADQYHQIYYETEKFSGPSLHFHRRALNLEGEVSESQRIELIYALLPSWGMHRMGGGPKMKPFYEFENSIRGVANDLDSLRHLKPIEMSQESWLQLERVFKGIAVMETKTHIVGNSKVMAHFLPGLIAPIDREYTLKFLFATGNIKNDLNHEWLLVRKILEEFFYPVINDRGFQQKACAWLSNQVYRWDTSILKVVDNLVICAMK